MLLIFGMIFTVLLPVSVKSFRSLQLVDTVRNITSLMRYIQNKAIIEAKVYSFDVDIENSTYSFSTQTNGIFEKMKETKTSLLSKKKIVSKLKIDSLLVKQKDFSAKEKSSICFYPDGSIDEAVFVLSNYWDEKIVIETNLSGSINVNNK